MLKITRALLLFAWSTLMAQNSVQSIYPQSSSTNYDSSSPVTASFSDPLNPETINIATVFVYSDLSGALTQTVVSYLSASNTISILLNHPLISGDRISVTLTANIISSDGVAITPFSWSFLSPTSPSPASFFVHSTAPCSTAVRELVLADFDGDDDIDLLLGVGEWASTPLEYFKNNGLGEFQSSEISELDFIEMVTLDIENDGDLDLALLTLLEEGEDFGLFIYENDGSGGLSELFSLPVPHESRNLLHKDLDNDGYQDIAFSYGALSQGLFVLFNELDGDFSGLQVPFSENLVGGGPLTSLDVDLDGDYDLIAFFPDPNGLHVFKNLGNQSFVESTFFANDPGLLFGSLSAIDFDGDNDDDLLATSSSDGGTVYYSNGDGTFSAGSSLEIGDATALGDFDGDGDIDLVFLAPANPRGLYRGLNNGTGDFTISFLDNSIGTNFSPGVQSSDFDGDGDLDLAIHSHYPGEIKILVNTVDVFPPARPTGVHSFYQGLYIVLSWWANTELDFSHYLVYRSVNNPDRMEILAGVEHPNSTYTDVSVSPDSSYYYCISAMDLLGNESSFSDTLSIAPLAADQRTPPNIDANTFDILSSYPNPFNSETSIHYSIPEAGLISLSIFDIHGVFIQGFQASFHEVGKYTYAWGGYNTLGQQQATGLYFIVLKTNNAKRTTKIALIK